ncbi:MAG TPA: response regulator [Usitatibacteraceae bacterium]|nr:response regulator [Usitatibacteraceae bacterium]
MPTEVFKRIVESLRTAVALADPKGVVAFANPAFAQLCGDPGHGVSAASLASFFHKDDARRVRQNIARIAEGKTASALLDVRVASGGAWVQLALQPALDSRDKPAGIVAVLHDIAGQRETESALNLTTARLMALVEASPNAALIENAAGEVELVNEAFCRLLGLASAPQSLLGLPAIDVIGRSAIVDARALARAHRKPDAPASIAFQPADNPPATLERQPLLVDEEPAGALWSSRAASVESPAEADGGSSEIALIEKIGAELSVALEGLSAISIRAQQMDFDPALVQQFHDIRASTETALVAIGDLVDFSKVEGGIELRRAGFRLRPAVADLVKRTAHAAEECRCHLRVKVEQDVPDHLEGDVERLQLLLRNLLESAFAAYPGAEVALAISPEYTTASGIHLSFAVTASSGGSERPAPRAAADPGMGVAVARFMVAAMGGKLEAGSRPPEPLYSFTIEFPVLPLTTPRRPAYVTLVGMSVLVVSANATQRHELSNLLRGWRMTPLEADNAAMAIALLERMHEEGSPVPLMLASDRLAPQDGFLLAFRVKNHPALQNTLVVMLATEGKPGDAIACRENGISAYLRYPLAAKQLNDAIVAVTGASVDSDETPTLVTRHSLREQRKGATILLVDGHRDSHMLAAHILRKRDSSLVVASDLAEAIASLDQDVYDIVFVDTALEGLDGAGAAAMLRSHIKRDPQATRLYATSVEHSPAFRTARMAEGFDGTLAKPFRRDNLLAVLAAIGKLPDETG